MPISFNYRMQTQPYDDTADNALRVEQERNSLLKTQQMVEQQRRGQLQNALMAGDWKGAAAADPQRAGDYLGVADRQRERALQAIAGKALGIYQAPSPRAAAQAQGLLEAFAQEAGKPPEALTDDEIRSMALADATRTGVVDVSKLKGPPQAPVPYEQSDDYKRTEHEFRLRERLARTEAGLRPPPASGGAAGSGGNDPKPTETDKRIGVMFGSMVDAESALARLPKDGPTTASKWNAALDSVPVISGATRTLQSDAYRQYESSALKWAANLLYIKSGATAPPEEVRSTYRQFFPQPGDGPEAIAQKETARRAEMENIRRMYPTVAAAYQTPAAPVQPAGGNVVDFGSLK